MQIWEPGQQDILVLELKQYYVQIQENTWFEIIFFHQAMARFIYYTRVERLRLISVKGIVTATLLFIISWMLRQNILSSGLKYEKSLTL